MLSALEHCKWEKKPEKTFMHVNSYTHNLNMMTFNEWWKRGRKWQDFPFHGRIEPSEMSQQFSNVFYHARQPAETLILLLGFWRNANNEMWNASLHNDCSAPCWPNFMLSAAREKLTWHRKVNKIIMDVESEP